MKADGHVERRRKCRLALAALIFGVLRIVEVVALEGQLEATSREILDGRNLLEELLQAMGLEPLERVQLHLDQVRNVEHGRNPGEGTSLAVCVNAVFDTNTRKGHTSLTPRSMDRANRTRQRYAGEGAESCGTGGGTSVEECRELTEGILRH